MIKVVLALLSYNIHAFEKFGGLDLRLGFTLKRCRSVCLSRAAHWGHRTGLPRDSGCPSCTVRLFPSSSHLRMSIATARLMTTDKLTVC